MEKNKLLKVSSILLIVFGALMALGALLFFVLGDMVAELIGVVGDQVEIPDGMSLEEFQALAKITVVILGVVMLVEAIAYIAAGVIGVQQKSPMACFIVGIILVVVCGIGAITNIVEGQVFSAIVGIIVPILYLVGAIQLKRAAADEVRMENEQNNQTM